MEAASTALARRKGLNPEKISNLVVLCALAGLAGAKVAMILFDWESHYTKNTQRNQHPVCR